MANYAQLLKKLEQITEYLSDVQIEITNLYEKTLVPEAANENIEVKLNKLIEQCNQAIDDLNTSEDNLKPNVIDDLGIIKYLLVDLRSVYLECSADMINQDMKDDLRVVLEEGKRDIRQVVLKHELQKLIKAMTIKAYMIEEISARNKLINTNEYKYENKIASLEKEHNELLQQLKQTMVTDPSHKERRSKITTLEAEISELRKQQASVIKDKEKNEEEIAALNAELQAMKTTKVKLIKQKREDNDRFRKWKADNELRLARWENLHDKQQNVLKEKLEEADSVNKRLKVKY